MEKKFFVRGVNSGIYYAEIVKREGQETEMKNARYVRMLSSVGMMYKVAVDGIPEPDANKLNPLDDIVLTDTPFKALITDTCEIVPISEKAVESIETQKPCKE